MLLVLTLPCTASLSHEHFPSQPHTLQKEAPVSVGGGGGGMIICLAQSVGNGGKAVKVLLDHSLDFMIKRLKDKNHGSLTTVHPTAHHNAWQ